MNLWMVVSKFPSPLHLHRLLRQSITAYRDKLLPPLRFVPCSSQDYDFGCFPFVLRHWCTCVFPVKIFVDWAEKRNTPKSILAAIVIDLGVILMSQATAHSSDPNPWLRCGNTWGSTTQIYRYRRLTKLLGHQICQWQCRTWERVSDSCTTGMSQSMGWTTKVWSIMGNNVTAVWNTIGQKHHRTETGR